LETGGLELGPALDFPAQSLNLLMERYWQTLLAQENSGGQGNVQAPLLEVRSPLLCIFGLGRGWAFNKTLWNVL
jgi:hypothetical protein